MRPLTPIEQVKMDGPRIRAPSAFISLTENVIALAFRTNPNKGLPDLAVKGMQKILEEDPELIWTAVRMTSKRLGIPESVVIQYLASQFNQPNEKEVVNE